MKCACKHWYNAIANVSWKVSMHTCSSRAWLLCIVTHRLWCFLSRVALSEWLLAASWACSPCSSSKKRKKRRRKKAVQRWSLNKWLAALIARKPDILLPRSLPFFSKCSSPQSSEKLDFNSKRRGRNSVKLVLLQTDCDLLIEQLEVGHLSLLYMRRRRTIGCKPITNPIPSQIMQ